MLSLFLLKLLLSIHLKADTISRNIINDYSPVSCETYPCIINCNEASSCRNTNISCPTTGEGICFINIAGSNAARNSIIYTHSATLIHINANGAYGLHASIVYAHTKIGSQLIMNSISNYGLRFATIYSPYGEGSELSITCTTSTTYTCANMQIYDDYSTTVNLYGYVSSAFTNTIVRNMFTDNTNYNITKSLSVNKNYRASVNIYSEDVSFQSFIYYGTDHGNWTIESRIGTQSQFLNAIIFADHSFVTDDSYTISVISEQSYGISNLKLYAAQNNVNIKLIGYDYGFWDSTTGQYFNLICSSSLQNIVINKLSMIGYGTQTFVTNFINITYPIRQIEFISNGSQSFYNIQMYFGNVLEALTIFDTQYRTWYSADITFNNIMGDVEFISNGTNTQSFQLIHLVINNIFGNLMFYDSSNGYAFRSSNININHINGSVTLHDISLNGYSFYNSYFSTG
eukprot:289930_1